jgi:hypothetical protein
MRCVSDKGGRTFPPPRRETSRPFNTIVPAMTRTVPLDAYVVDVLMRDLVGHDRAPSAFVVYLWLWRNGPGAGRSRVGASLQTIATQTGLSKSAVQGAVRRLARRRLVTANRSRATEAPVYEVHMPWRREAVTAGAEAVKRAE